MRPKKTLGQHFLTSKAVVSSIIKAAQLSPSDTVLEVGPGKGVLTETLLENAGKVIAVEKDDRLIAPLREKFANEIADGKLTLVHGDILDFSPESHKLRAGSYSVVANIPYYITGALLRHFLESNTPPERMVLLLQKEVAERIVAKDGKESILSMSVKVYGEPKYKKSVPARCFSPKPKVDSAILSIENISKHWQGQALPMLRIVKLGFSHKRKTLLNNLSVVSEKKAVEDALAHCGIPSGIRAEKLSVENWMCLTRRLPLSPNSHLNT
ncbi:MAG: 16S rRNA (adenine(1518)-N(6)/adenine(1519)-N(6)) -dimethyltransferase RsmA [Patescibacteria group bacterium]|nr:MAG: 16S rRNA (adenine(1518)-N(6)/adenine(1519)-N(6)) -dimethyltransferase RsmA [Patescibacteria group bacterium]